MRQVDRRDRAAAEDRSWVYFIRCGDDGPIKIGMSVDPKQRMANLQIAMPFLLRLLGQTRGGYAREAALHRQFAKHRTMGEWFDPAPELLDFIAHLEPEHATS